MLQEQPNTYAEAMPRRSHHSHSLPACYAITFPGLEEVASQEIAQELSGEIRRCSPGLIVFRVPEITRDVLRLKTVEDVFLLGWGTDKLTYRAADLEQIRRWTSHEADWNRLLQIHHEIRPKPQGKPTFHLVTQMTGHHGYRREDARKALVKGLTKEARAFTRTRYPIGSTCRLQSRSCPPFS